MDRFVSGYILTAVCAKIKSKSGFWLAVSFYKNSIPFNLIIINKLGLSFFFLVCYNYMNDVMRL
jgi:hypothetical protein